MIAQRPKDCSDTLYELSLAFISVMHFSRVTANLANHSFLCSQSREWCPPKHIFIRLCLGARCHALMDLPNGYVQYPRDFKVGSVAFYGCYNGYVIIGANSRVCQGNLKWSGSEPLCHKNDSSYVDVSVKCERPPEIPFTKHDAPEHQSLFNLDTLVHYTCIKGFYRQTDLGLPKAKCLMYNGKARWFGPDIQCHAFSCGRPTEVTNAIMDGSVFTYPHSVRYRCIDGFEIVGDAERWCLVDGHWSGDKPFCKPIQCVRPKPPLYGQVLGTSLEFQAKITYVCDEGYRLVGQVQRICQSDTTWSGHEPYCEEIRCPSLGLLWNGFIDGDDTSFGAMVIFRCLEGMTHIGAPYAKCQRDGTWTHPLPKCMGKQMHADAIDRSIIRWSNGRPMCASSLFRHWVFDYCTSGKINSDFTRNAYLIIIIAY
ncbi:unnamed protein product [Soboliphyme baturini]|uniref:Sushi, von Willebrand factor type A, EGF and pentraxin domain-containing protein 1 n=1 Tax=Soboliphyme baturini TaxID=241478 RepID=A0A183IVZ9_9BILA|nr:unnamed protein product [Soboliphyme baturini]